MMPAVGEQSDEREDRGQREQSEACAGDLAAFAGRLRRQHLRGAVLDAVLRVVLGVGVPALALAWFVASWRLPIAALVGALATASAARAALRARCTANAVLLRVADADAVDDPRLLAEIGDELATWLEADGRAAAPMRAWLARDVRGKLPALAPSTVNAVGRRRLGALAWIVPLLVLLLIAWFLTNLLSPPWPGVLGGRANRPDTTSGSGGSGSGGSGRGEGRSEHDGKQPPSPKKPKPQPVPPPPSAANNEQPKPEEPPAPLLPLPDLKRFVVPDFIGDGPTRRARMNAAEIEQGAPESASTQRTGDAPAEAPPPPQAQQFARAAERALASRHVPTAEQPMVRRYFSALQQAGK
jgi:hypothetical protein